MPGVVTENSQNSYPCWEIRHHSCRKLCLLPYVLESWLTSDGLGQRNAGSCILETARFTGYAVQT